MANVKSEDQDKQPNAHNRKAYHDYFIEETYEAGLVLTGSEIKSIRDGKINLRDSYAQIVDGELWVHNMHIASYEQAGTHYNHEPTRPRKLLMHRREIRTLIGKIQQKGLTIVPTKLYFKKRRAKLEVAVAKGKKLYDKRDAMAERDAKRDMQRQAKEF